ncbi:hypothetical protein DZF91_37250 [Actinomadura logoneensis]|uniref:Uncharacterized protein n=1 Tax=Actinomadura logoneensis TaxID=2293572 RepID=A0A372J9Y0_9ACTN|nr:hypothetical protein [Actinomadura logoneensis]RFU36614.1 hypothetical protein DZF91_37250 [Actinomadura logoneensis]
MAPADNTARAGLSSRLLATRLGLTAWQLRLAWEHGLMPEPDLPEGRWSTDAADRCAERVEAVKTAFGEDAPLGAERAAARLAARVKLDVERADVEVLVAQDALEVVGRYRGHPLYLMRDLDALAPAVVAKVVRARKGILGDSVDPGGAARILQWPRGTFERVVAERGLTPDRLGRYALADVQALADDRALKARVTKEHRHAVLLKAEREEARQQANLREWIRACNAFLDRETSAPPPFPALRRAMQALIAARSITTAQDP